MRVGRHFFHHSGHFTRYLVVCAGKDEYLPDRVFVLEIFTGNAFGDYHLPRHGETGFLIAFQKFEIKKAKKAGFGIRYLILPQGQFTVFHYLFRLE